MSLGEQYVATVRLSNRANETLADVGATCERVPENALREWIIPQGLAVLKDGAEAEVSPAIDELHPRASRERMDHLEGAPPARRRKLKLKGEA